MASAYDDQHRGDDRAYDRYLAGMDASMRQKVALTAAHLLSEGRIADMGMGSGTGSLALAALYPGLEVVGVDVNPEMVARASDKHRLPNLRFVVGDIAKTVFEPASLDAILDSSVLHHVTTFSDYDYDAARRALRTQVDQLRHGGTLIVRDFLAPPSGEVVLDVPDDDGDDTDDPQTCSTAQLLRRFSREFRKQSEQPGFELSEGPSPRLGWRRFHLTHRVAVEFLLRKDYRRDWDLEVLEEYTYFTQREFEDLFAALGLRVLASTPIRNPWIVANRFRGKFELTRPDGSLVVTPPTNYVIVGERVEPGKGVQFVEIEEVAPLGFVWMEHFRHKESGAVYDLAVRPNPTIDVVPYFVAADDVYLVARKSYPRPILQHRIDASASLDGSSPTGYVTEPLNVPATGRPLARVVEDALATHAGIDAREISSFTEGCRFFPSPGGIEQLNHSVWVEIEARDIDRAIEASSDTSTSGLVRPIEARQLLRAAHVGGLPDARLEIAAYGLLRARGQSWGPWIGAEVALDDQAQPPPAHPRPAKQRRAFEPASAEHSQGFLRLRAARFDELDGSATIVANPVREYVLPSKLSNNTVCIAALWRCGEAIYMGAEDRDLPACQSYLGRSNLLVAPAWRLPHEIATLDDAEPWITERLASEHGLRIGRIVPLGAPYYADPGVTPETIHPFAVEVVGSSEPRAPLHWRMLEELAAKVGIDELDGQLTIAALRAAHALGVR